MNQLLLVVLLLLVVTTNRIVSRTKFGVIQRKMLSVQTCTLQKLVPCEADLSPLQFYNGKLYTIDYRSQSIIVIDTNGTITQTFGKRGPGAPGEFKQLLMFSVNDKGISALDVGSTMITEFLHNGSIARFYKHNKTISRAIRIDQDHYLLKAADVGSTKDEQFEVVNIANKKIQSIKAQRKMQNNDELTRDIIVDGEFVTNNEGIFIRFSHKAGEFVAFGKNGNFLYRASTIDETLPPPPAKSAGSKGTSVSYGFSRTINLSATADKRYLYIISNAPSPSIKDSKPDVTSDRVVDVYNIANGQYMFSFMLPILKEPNSNREMRATYMTISSQGLFVAFGGNYLARFAVQLPK